METRREQERTLKWQRILVAIGIFLFFAYEADAFAKPPEGQIPQLQTARECPRFDRGRPSSMTMPAFWKNPSMATYLQLSKDQGAALNKAFETYEHQTKGLHAGRIQAQRDLEQALRQSPVNENKVRSLAANIATDESRLIGHEIEFRLQVAKVLTDQQKKAIEALKPPMCAHK